MGPCGSWEESRPLRETGAPVCLAKQRLSGPLCATGFASVFVSLKALTEPVPHINTGPTLHYSVSRRRLLMSSVEWLPPPSSPSGPNDQILGFRSEFES